ncbi:MAG: hypothetical protein ACRYFW_14905 [Janthinobacterium lividum]
MKDFTVNLCDQLAEQALDAARTADSRADRARHLDRAAAFAHCSEEGRKDAARVGRPLDGKLPCRPVASALE